MQVDIFHSADDLRDIKDSWERVYEADPEAQFFLSWTWIHNWFRSQSFNFLILAVRPEGDGSETGDHGYVAFFPLRISSQLDANSGFRHTIHMAASYYAGYTGFICDPRWQAQAIGALGQALKDLNWAEVHLDDIFNSEERLNMLFGCFPEKTFSIQRKTRGRHTAEDGQNIDHDVYVLIPLESDWEAFLQNNLGSKTRYNARNALRQVEKNAEFRIAVADSDTIDGDLEKFIELWHARWEADNPGYADYIVDCTRAMIRRCFDDGTVFVPVMWQGDKRVAVNINLVDRNKGRLIQFLAGRDQSVKRPPPGFVLHLFAIRWAIENGFRIYDFGTGNFSYKYDFGAEEILVRRYRIAVQSGDNLRGPLDALSLTPAWGETLRIKARGGLSAAESGCRAILAFDPGHGAARKLQEEIESDREEAAAALAEAIRRHRDGQLEEADRLYRDAVKWNPENALAWHYLGLTLYQRGMLQQAAKILNKALELDPLSAAAHNNLGSALARLDRLPEALKSYERALELKPDYAQASINLAATRTRIGAGEQHGGASGDGN